MALKDMTKAQLVDIILRKDDVEIRLKQEIVLLKQEKERLDKEYKRMKRLRTLTIFLILAIMCVVSVVFSACATPKKTAEETGEVRWPDLLRDWAADYGVNDAQQLAIIDEIDMVYRLVEDSTADNELLCAKLCKLKDELIDFIVHDPSLEFPLMMRATALNFYGKLYNNSWLIKADCPCNVMDYLLINAHWYTSSREHFDIMYTTFLAQSWQTPYRFTNMVLSKEDGNEMALVSLIVYNYIDTAINNLQINFTNADGTVIERLTEKDVYVDSTNMEGGTKMMVLPTLLVMDALTESRNITITYETSNETVEMIGFPHVFFTEQINDCPRLMKVFNQITH